MAQNINRDINAIYSTPSCASVGRGCANEKTPVVQAQEGTTKVEIRATSAEMTHVQGFKNRQGRPR